jgi:hypothetical protein
MQASKGQDVLSAFPLLAQNVHIERCNDLAMHMWGGGRGGETLSNRFVQANP